MRTIRIGSSLARRYPRALRVQREQAELRRHESLRPAAAASTLLVMALMLGACADSDSSALPGGDGTTTAVPSSSEPATESTDSPSPTESGWESDFTPDHLAEYDEALARWEDYEDESAPLWADPKPSPETLNFFASYFYNENFMQQRLTRLSVCRNRSHGAVTVLWSKAIRIRGKAVHDSSMCGLFDIARYDRGQATRTGQRLRAAGDRSQQTRGFRHI